MRSKHHIPHCTQLESRAWVKHIKNTELFRFFSWYIVSVGSKVMGLLVSFPKEIHNLESVHPVRQIRFPSTGSTAVINLLHANVGAGLLYKLRHKENCCERFLDWNLIQLAQTVQKTERSRPYCTLYLKRTQPPSQQNDHSITRSERWRIFLIQAPLSVD